MVRLGIIGRNFVVDWMMGAIREVPEIQPVAIYSRTMEGARAFADAYNLPLTFDSLEDLAACDQVDAVYIASPNCCHFEQSRLMLEHGKHVLCEKPAVPTAKQLQLLLQTAREHHVVFLEAMRLVHDDALEVIRQALPRIGTLRRVSFEFTQYSSRYDRVRAGEPNINAFNPALSNGSIMDMGTYPIHAIAWMFGRPEKVHAVCTKMETGFDLNGIVLMQYPGFVAEAIYSKCSGQIAPTTFMGEDGSILLDDVNRTKRIWLQPRKGEPEELPYAEKLPINMTCELRHFCDMVAGRADPAPWNEASLITLEIMDKARADTNIKFPGEV